LPSGSTKKKSSCLTFETLLSGRLGMLRALSTLLIGSYAMRFQKRPAITLMASLWQLPAVGESGAL
jgi:hypothetical protein